MKLKKVRIHIQSVEDVKNEWSHALRGELKGVQKPNTLVFTSLRAVAKVLSPVRLELLGMILKHKPESISSLAKILGRDFKNVYADVKLLASVGILELKAAGKRDAVKPVALYSGFELDLAA
jgi:predicted transcriptional regulator